MKIIHDSSLLHSKINEYAINNMFNAADVPFELRLYDQGELVLREGEAMDNLLFLVDGKVKISSSIETGKALLLRFCEPLSIIGDVELIQKIVVQSQVEAVSQSFFIALSFTYIEEHAMNEPKFLQSLLTHVTYKLKTCTAASRVNLLASVENRFASYLLTTLNAEHEYSKEIKTKNTQEMAELIGTTSRHLNRIILKLSEQGMIQKQGDSIYVINRDKLQKISNGIRYE